MGDRKPSEIIQDFIDLLNYANDIYTKSKSECEQLDSIERVRSWQHKFEFAKGMLNLQKRTEEYLESDREYKAGDGDDSNRG